MFNTFYTITYRTETGVKILLSKTVNIKLPISKLKYNALIMKETILFNFPGFMI